MLEAHFEKRDIFFTPTARADLAEIFAQASKAKTGRRGIPDRLLYDGRTLVVIECKVDLTTCVNDLRIYQKLMICPKNIKLFFVAFVSVHVFQVFSETMTLLEGAQINPAFFGMQVSSKAMTDKQMDNQIHKIHNYIRDNTKISDVDKPFFIACILLACKKNSFRALIEKYESTNGLYIFDILYDCIKSYEIDLSVFEFFRNDRNNVHFLKLIKMVLEVMYAAPSEDLINTFYHEFVQYNNRDSKQLGIVLTPDHIVDLMCNLVEVGTGDHVLDICTGTGSFLIKAHTRGARIVGCEFQRKLFTLLRCNTLLYEIEECVLFNDDCFNVMFPECNKCIINPPYGMKEKKELDFVIHSLKFLRIKGLLAVILPVGCINNRKNFAKRAEVTALAAVRKIVFCNKNLFFPVASTQTCILVLQKERSGHDWSYDKCEMYDYRDDGIEIKKHRGKVKTERFAARAATMQGAPVVNALLDKNTGWMLPSVDTSIVSASAVAVAQVEHAARAAIVRLMAEVPKVPKPEVSAPVKVGSLFEAEACKGDLNVPEGVFPLVSASKINGGIAKYCATWKYENAFTIAKDGSAGHCFFHNYKFSATGHVIVLRPKCQLTLEQSVEIAVRMTQRFAFSIYGFAYPLTIERLMAEDVMVPVSIMSKE